MPIARNPADTFEDVVAFAHTLLCRNLTWLIFCLGEHARSAAIRRPNGIRRIEIVICPWVATHECSY